MGQGPKKSGARERGIKWHFPSWMTKAVWLYHTQVLDRPNSVPGKPARQFSNRLHDH